MGSYNVKLLVHVVFSTQARQELISLSVEKQLYAYLDSQCAYFNSPLLAVNGTANHVHLLVMLSNEKSVSDFLHQIKGTSSHWLNQSNLINVKFAWQKGYSAFSVSESQSVKVV